MTTNKTMSLLIHIEEQEDKRAEKSSGMLNKQWRSMHLSKSSKFILIK